MPKSLPNTHDLLQWLAEHPAALEPGLVFYQGPLELSRGLEVALHGVDPLGRPCVVHAPKEIDAGAIEWMVEVVAGLRAEAKRLTRWYTRASEPRVFLITQHLKRPERERLALLADAFPLRVFSWEWSNEKDAAPSFLLELPLPGEHFLQALEGLDEEIRRPGQRILQAADQITPPLIKVGTSWPLVFIGSRGPCASLYRDGENLVFAGQQAGAPEVLEIVDDESADAAIDRLMREQWSALGSS
jgi:hypothetical protein